MKGKCVLSEVSICRSALIVISRDANSTKGVYQMVRLYREALEDDRRITVILFAFH